MKTKHLYLLRHFARGSHLAFGVCLLLLSATVARGSGEVSPPSITSFEITPATAKSQEAGWIEISWEAEGADGVKLYRDGEEMRGRQRLANGEIGWPASMSFRIRNAKPAVYELVAENSAGKTTKSVQLKGSPTAPAPPKILSFRAAPPTIRPGDEVSLFWEVKDAEEVRLYDAYGEIESRIVLPSGKLGWPLSMNGELSEVLSEATTYKLVATSKIGSASTSFAVTLAQVAEEKPPAADESCRATVTITGIYGKFTDAVGVLEAQSSGPGKFLFKSPVSTVRDHRKSGAATVYQRANVTLPPGAYFLVPVGGGNDTHGDFSVLFKPGRTRFTCRGGESGRVSFQADHAEY